MVLFAYKKHEHTGAKIRLNVTAIATNAGRSLGKRHKELIQHVNQQIHQVWRKEITANRHKTLTENFILILRFSQGPLSTTKFMIGNF